MVLVMVMVLELGSEGLDCVSPDADLGGLGGQRLGYISSGPTLHVPSIMYEPSYWILYIDTWVPDEQFRLYCLVFYQLYMY